MKKGSKNFLLTFSMICLIFVPAIATYSLATSSDSQDLDLKEDEEISNNVSILNNFEDKDLAKIENQVNKIQSSYYGLDKDSKKINYKDIFRSSVIMGDSQSEGLTIYNILNSTSVIAKKGSNLVDARSNMNTLSNLNPSNVFTLYGMNDLLIYNEDVDNFIKDYKALINEVKKTLPNANIFVNSILPVQEKVLKKRPVYNKVDDYNESLEKMCKDLEITFVDVSTLLINNEELYEGDGMHLKPSFYPAWLDILKKSASL